MMMRIALLVLILLITTVPAVQATENMMPTGEIAVCSDDWIYYRAYDYGESALCKVRIDGTGGQILAQKGCNYLTVSGDTVYFTGIDGIYRVGTDGSDLQQLELMTEYGWWYGGICSTGDYIYIGADDAEHPNNSNILKYSVDPWELIAKYPIGEASSMRMLIKDDWIYMARVPYYQDSPSRFYRIRTDGSGFEKCFPPAGDKEISMWTILDGWMYYNLADTIAGKAELRRVKLDGTGDELILEGLYARWMLDGWVYGMKYGDEITFLEPALIGGTETSTCYDRYGVFRVSLETGEEQRLDDLEILNLMPVGNYILDEMHVPMNGEAAILRNPDGSELMKLPLPRGGKIQ